MSEGQNIEQQRMVVETMQDNKNENLGRRAFLKKILPHKEYLKSKLQDQIPETFNKNPIQKYSRRRFLELSAKGATSLITTVALEKFSNFVSGNKESFAQQIEEPITDQKCEEFFTWCHNRIHEIDTKGNQKTDELVLELAEFEVECAVSVYYYFSSHQKKKFNKQIDYFIAKADDLRTDHDWDLDAESNMNEIKNIPSWLLLVREYGRIVASEVKEKRNASTHLSIVHFGDIHDWNSRNDDYNSTLEGHDEMYKMFNSLYKQNDVILGNEQEYTIEQSKEMYGKELRDLQRMQTDSTINTKIIQDIQDKLKYDAIFKINENYPKVKIVPIDMYARDNKIDHDSYSNKRDKAHQAYDKASAIYYDIKKGNSKGNINTAAKEVIQKEQKLSDLEKEQYDERSRFAVRRMIAEMLLAHKLQGVIIFGMADGKYFLEEVKKINKDGESFLNDLKRDNEKIYEKVISTYSLAELKQLAIELYMVIPKAFLPYE